MPISWFADSFFFFFFFFNCLDRVVCLPSFREWRDREKFREKNFSFFHSRLERKKRYSVKHIWLERHSKNFEFSKYYKKIILLSSYQPSVFTYRLRIRSLLYGHPLWLFDQREGRLSAGFFCPCRVMSFSRHEPRNNEMQTAWRNARRARIAHATWGTWVLPLYADTSPPFLSLSLSLLRTLFCLCRRRQFEPLYKWSFGGLSINKNRRPEYRRRISPVYIGKLRHQFYLLNYCQGRSVTCIIFNRAFYYNYALLRSWLFLRD